MYYITHALIPPLERVFNLVGADVSQWFMTMPKSFRADDYVKEDDDQRRSTSPIGHEMKKTPGTGGRFKIDAHFRSSQCLTCGDVTSSSNSVCDRCKQDPKVTVAELLGRVHRAERRLINVQRICASCSSVQPTEPIECENVDCAWLYERVKATRKVAVAAGYQQLANSIELE